MKSAAIVGGIGIGSGPAVTHCLFPPSNHAAGGVGTNLGHISGIPEGRVRFNMRLEGGFGLRSLLPVPGCIVRPGTGLVGRTGIQGPGERAPRLNRRKSCQALVGGRKGSGGHALV